MDEYLKDLRPVNTKDENRVDVEMLQNALALSNKKVRECMVPRTEIIALDMESSMNTLRQKFIQTSRSRNITR